MLDGRGNDLVLIGAKELSHRPEHGIIGFGRATGKEHFSRIGMDGVRDVLAGAFDERRGLAAGSVERGGIAKMNLQRPVHGALYTAADRRGGVVVEVDLPPDLKNVLDELELLEFHETSFAYGAGLLWPQGRWHSKTEITLPAIAGRDLVYRLAGADAPFAQRITHGDDAVDVPAGVLGYSKQVEDLVGKVRLEHAGERRADALRAGGQHGAPHGGVDAAAVASFTEADQEQGDFVKVLHQVQARANDAPQLAFGLAQLVERTAHLLAHHALEPLPIERRELGHEGG